jgi:hypothetical protein
MVCAYFKEQFGCLLMMVFGRILINWHFARSWFDFKIIHFYASYFPYDRENDMLSIKSDGKDNKFEYNFLMICRC